MKCKALLLGMVKAPSKRLPSPKDLSTCKHKTHKESAEERCTEW